MKEKLKENKKQIIIALVLFCIALVSVLGVARIASEPETYAGTIAVLDGKRDTAMGMTAAAVVASTAVGMIPGDATTAIANQILDLSGYMLIVMCVIILEKFLLTLLGFVSFALLIPAACVLGIVFIFVKKEMLRNLAVKLAAFGLVVCIIIPVGVRVGQVIENTHKASIAELTTIAVEQEMPEEEVPTEEETAVQPQPEEEIGWLKKAWNTVKGKSGQALEAVKTGVVKVVDSLEDGVEKGKQIFWKFVEGVAVMLVTTCLIPIATMAVMLWLTGKVFNIPMEKGAKALTAAKKKLKGQQEEEPKELAAAE